jgi:hypothetical protein
MAFGFAPPRDHYFGALLDENLGRALADAAGSASDDANSILQT